MSFTSTRPRPPFKSAFLSGHPLSDIVVSDFLEEGGLAREIPGEYPETSLRPIEIPFNAAERIRFIKAFREAQVRRRAKGLSPQLLVLPLAALGLAQGLDAQAAESAEGADDAWVDAATLSPVVEVIPQTDGSVVLVLPGQQVVRFGSEAVRMEGDTVLVPRLEAFAKGLASAEDAEALQSLADL